MNELDGPYSIRPAPGTCCPDMKIINGVCSGCDTKHGGKK